MNYIYMVEHGNYLSQRELLTHVQTHTPVFVNFNIGYSIFHTYQNTLFSKIMFYPSFICVSVHIHIIYYSRES